MSVEIRPAERNQEAAERLYAFIRPMAQEVALAPVDDQRAFQNMAAIVDQGHSFVAWDGDEIVGALGLTMVPYWYAEDTFLIDRFLYVRPDRRFGEVGVKLLRAGRDEGKRTGKSVFILVANPDRKVKQDEAAMYATVAGFSPMAHLLQLHKAPVAGAA